MILASDRSKKITYADAMKNAGLPQIELLEQSPANPMANHTAYSYAVHFVKVKVHSINRSCQSNKSGISSRCRKDC